MAMVVVVVIAQQLFSYRQLSRLRKSVTAAGLSHRSCTDGFDRCSMECGATPHSRQTSDMPLVMRALWLFKSRQWPERNWARDGTDWPRQQTFKRAADFQEAMVVTWTTHLTALHTCWRLLTEGHFPALVRLHGTVFLRISEKRNANLGLLLSIVSKCFLFAVYWHSDFVMIVHYINHHERAPGWSVAVSTSCLHRSLSWASRHAELSPWLSGWRSAFRVRSQVWRGCPGLRLQSLGSPQVDVCRALKVSWESLIRATCPKKRSRLVWMSGINVRLII